MSHRVSKSITRSISGLAFALATLGSFGSLVGINATATDYTVSLNKTKILHLPGPAATVIVGNPDIADISVHSSDTLFIIGRGYGVTNLIALDEFGQTIMEAEITVQSGMPPTGMRIINIGTGQESYNCTPLCLPAPILGDSAEFIGQFSSNAATINNASASGSPQAANGFGGAAGTALSTMPALYGPPNAAPMAQGQFAGPPVSLSANDR